MAEVTAEIISVGDELLIGQVVNTNAAYLGEALTALGFRVCRVSAVGDEAEDLREALATAIQRSDVVIVTGGLGSTHDDITKEVVADFFHSGFVVRPEIAERIRKAFAKRGMKMAAANEDQARVPDKAELIHNPIGSAPGFLFTKNEKLCFVLPGVPAEMEAMCEASVFRRLRGLGGAMVQKTVRTIGLPESTLFERFGDVRKLEQERGVKVAFLPRMGGVDVRITARGADRKACEQRVARVLRFVEETVPEYIYGYDREALEDVVARLLFSTGQTLAVAESCTGGLLAHKLTNVPGSSDYFERCVVSYSNRAKVEILGVPQSVLERHGAVSAETAEAMASGIRRLSGTDFGVSTTGIAGPSGGTEAKPVGLVFIGLATAEGVWSERFHFFKDRRTNKERFAQAALNLLRQELIKLANGSKAS